MLHTKFQNHRPPGSEEDFKRFLLFIQLSFTLLKDAPHKKVQVGKNQEKAQSEKDSHSKNHRLSTYTGYSD